MKYYLIESPFLYCNHTFTRHRTSLQKHTHIHSFIDSDDPRESLPDLRPDPTDTLPKRNRAVIPNSSELIRRRIGRKPLLNFKALLRALSVDSCRRDLHVVNIPAMVVAGAVGSQIQRTDWARKTRCFPTENVEITPLVVFVTWSH